MGFRSKVNHSVNVILLKNTLNLRTVGYVNFFKEISLATEFILN